MARAQYPESPKRAARVTPPHSPASKLSLRRAFRSFLGRSNGRGSISLPAHRSPRFAKRDSPPRFSLRAAPRRRIASPTPGPRHGRRRPPRRPRREGPVPRGDREQLRRERCGEHRHAPPHPRPESPRALPRPAELRGDSPFAASLGGRRRREAAEEGKILCEFVPNFDSFSCNLRFCVRNLVF